MNEKDILIETMQRCSLADFTFEAFCVVDASSCSHGFAFDLRSTLATFLHVGLHICEDHYHDDDHNGYYDGHADELLYNS